MARILVPANLLLLGEYAVLEEGGLGIALAVEPEVTVRTASGDRLSITGEMGGAAVRWPGPDTALFGWVVEACAKERGGAADLPLAIAVDSRAFFDPRGRKIGLGSSASVAVGVAGAILAAGASGGQREVRIFNAALAGHRAFQGGRGSGYDVAVSLHGGAILFFGGSRPRYESIALPWLPPFAFVRGSGSVSTRQSVAAYDNWKLRDPERASRYLAESNRLVETFARSSSWDEARPIFDAFARHAAALGRAIGSPSEIRLPGDRAETTGKAVGAGNELGVVFLDPVTEPGRGDRAPAGRSGAARVRISSAGTTIDGQAVAGRDTR